MDPKILASLRIVLAKLYPDEPSIRRISADSGIDLSRTLLNSTTVNNWHSVLIEAEKIHRVEALLGAVEFEYGNNKELQNACAAYRRSTGQIGDDQNSVVKPGSLSDAFKKYLNSIVAVMVVLILAIIWAIWGLGNGPKPPTTPTPNLVPTYTSTSIPSASRTESMNVPVSPTLPVALAITPIPSPPTPEPPTEPPTSSPTFTPIPTSTPVAPTIAILSNERGVALGFTMEQLSDGDQEAILVQIVDQFGVIYEISQKPTLRVSVYIDRNRTSGDTVLGCTLNRDTFNWEGWNWIFIKILDNDIRANVNKEIKDGKTYFDGCGIVPRNQMLNGAKSIDEVRQSSKGVLCPINRAVESVLDSYRSDSQTCP